MNIFLLAASLSTVAAFAGQGASDAPTRTPIQHLVVIFQENVSFDHYFATYPIAANKPGERPFYGKKDTPTVNGLSEWLLAHNPNSAQPVRLGPGQAATCDQDHDYVNEQQAAHGGLMDKFVEFTGTQGGGCDPKIVMDYFDGNTVTALWNYAQSFALNDNSFGTSFGPSTPGALNLVSGQTHGSEPADFSDEGERMAIDGTIVSDPDPSLDDCSAGKTALMKGTNVGDLLNKAGVSWGWFEGGFAPTGRSKDGRAICGAKHAGSDGKARTDYLPHHEPFQYYRSTANPHHLPPSSVERIGLDDQASHQYDLSDFWAAAEKGRLPAVSYLKAPGYQDGHAGYSDPLREQEFLVETINRLQALPQWKDMAIVVSYDDSDGWYDHVMPPIVNQSRGEGDALLAPGSCGKPAAGVYPGRCGHGPRLPLLVISPFARANFVDHSITDQTSILRFIEDNWDLGRIGDQSFDEKAGSLIHMFDFESDRRAPKLFLDPKTGEPKR